MTKTCKKLLLAVLFAVFATCMGLFAACSNTPKDTAVTYTVTVMKDAETPASGVTVQIAKGSATFESKNTGVDGKVEFELAPDSYDVKLSNIPEHYSIPANAKLKLTADDRTTAVTLEKNFSYTVKLVKPDGTPYYAQGVTVGLCTLDGNCYQPVNLEQNGTVIIEHTAGDYHVKVNDLPANVYVEVDGDGYYTGKNFSATDREMTITVYEVTAVDLTAKMTENEKNAYAQNNSAYNANEEAKKYNACKTVKQLAAGEVAFFKVTPSLSGRYYMYADEIMSYSTMEAGGYFSNGINRTLKAGESYYVKAVNESAATAAAELVITSPYSSYIESTGKGTNLELVVGKDNTNAIVAFHPAEAGTYAFTVKGETLAAVGAPATQPGEFLEEAPADNAYIKNASVETVVTAKNAANGIIVYFTVTAKGEYPATVNAEIKKTAESKDTYAYAKVTETLTKYEKPAGKELYDIPLDGTAEALVYNQTDKFYHYGAVDGPVVVVNITKPLDTTRFEEGAALAYMELIHDNLATYEFDVTEKDAESQSLINYTVFLRGFNENGYKQQGRGKAIPDAEDIETEVYYAKYVNEDGVYPLTEELKVFLEKFVEANKEPFLTSWAAQLPSDTEPEDAWMFPCFYYGDEIPADAIVGEYKLVSIAENGNTYNLGDAYEGDVLCNSLNAGENLTAECAIIKLNKNGSVLVLLYQTSEEGYVESDPYDSGSWTKEDDGTYTFNLGYGTLTYSNGTFTYVDGETVIVFGVAPANA